MPDYTIRDPATGRTLTVRGDSPPTEAELEQLFASAHAKRPVDASVSAPNTEAPPTAPSSPISSAAAGAAPTVGGIIGGIMGGIPGAAVGGAAGEGYGQLIKHASEIPGAVADVAQNLVSQPAATMKGAAQGALQGAEDAGISGAVQGAGQAIGSGLAAVASKAAPWMMTQATGIGGALAREFPDLSQTMIDHALTVTQGGLDKARALLSGAKASANAALASADQAGARVPFSTIREGLKRTLESVQDSSDIAGNMATLARIEQRVGQGRWGDSLSMKEADALKTSLQTEARALYKAVAAGNGRRGASMEMQAKADMAQALNAAIEKAATEAGAPGYKAANSAAQDLIGATRAISKRLLKNTLTPAQLASNVATAGLTTPAGMSHLAVYLSHPVVQGFLRALPQPVLASFASLYDRQDQP